MHVVHGRGAPFRSCKQAPVKELNAWISSDDLRRAHFHGWEALVRSLCWGLETWMCIHSWDWSAFGLGALAECSQVHLLAWDRRLSPAGPIRYWNMFFLFESIYAGVLSWKIFWFMTKRLQSWARKKTPDHGIRLRHTVVDRARTRAGSLGRFSLHLSQVLVTWNAAQALVWPQDSAAWNKVTLSRIK
jgi:hypothetical protein